MTGPRKNEPAYRSWMQMRRRCLSPLSHVWKDYGGRGITICKRWSNYENFLQDLGPRPKGMSLDRIDNNGNYEPGNCRWTTQKIQSNNTRSNRLMSAFGRTMNLSEWAEQTGVKLGTIWIRLERGFDAESALSKEHLKRRWLPTPAKGEATAHVKLTESQVREIIKRRTLGEPQKRLSKEFGVSVHQIWMIANRRSWKHLD